MNFLEDMNSRSVAYLTIVVGKQFVSLCRTIKGQPFSKQEKFILDKFITGALNTRPPTKWKMQEIWDVNTLLDYLVKAPENTDLPINQLAGKLFLLIALSQMCRTNEIMQLNLDHMRIMGNGIEFTLPCLVKTVHPKTLSRLMKLQTMTIKAFSGDKNICPLTTLAAYIKRTKFLRREIQNLFILTTAQLPKAASCQSVVCWAKNILNLAGLGVFTVASTRASSSSKAIALGYSLDKVISRCGWLSQSTFVRYYLLPLQKLNPLLNDTLRSVSQDIEDNAKLHPDRHQF